MKNIPLIKKLLLAVTFFFCGSVFAATGSDIGDTFHNIKITDEQGQPHALSEFRGKVVVAKFWGSWCGICAQKWPGHQALYNNLKDNPNVVFLTISFAEPLARSKQFAASRQYTVPLYHGSNLGLIKVVDEQPFQPRGTPYKLLIDRDGVIQQSSIGMQPGFTAEQVLGLL
jgi:peroxiredoxin